MHIQTPWGSLALILLLMLDLWAVRRLATHTSAFGQPKASLRSPILPTVPGDSTRTLYFRLNSRGLEFVSESRGTGLGYPVSKPTLDARFTTVSLEVTVDRTGGLAPWVEDLAIQMRTNTFGKTWLINQRQPMKTTENERAAIRTGVVSFLESRGETQTAALLRADELRSTRLLWLGPLHDLFFLLGAFLLLASLRWVPPLLVARNRALARGLCPTCRYNLKAIRGTGPHGRTKQCPECGSTWEL